MKKTMALHRFIGSWPVPPQFSTSPPVPGRVQHVHMKSSVRTGHRGMVGSGNECRGGDKKLPTHSPIWFTFTSLLTETTKENVDLESRLR